MEIGTIFSALTLLMLALNFSFGRGDKGSARIEALERKHAAKIDSIEEKQHQQELSMMALEARMRDHVGGGYATKSDIAGLKAEIAGFRLIFQPIADQLTIKASR